MGQIRKRGVVSRTSELEMAEEEAILGLAKIRAVRRGASKDFKGVAVALKTCQALAKSLTKGGA